MITRHFIDRNPPPDQNRCFKTIYFDPKSNRRIAAFHIGLSLSTHNYLEHDLQNIEYSSLCYTVGSCWLSILHIVVYMLIPNS